MLIALHKNATTTPATRLALQQASGTDRELAQQYGIGVDTVRKWRHRFTEHRLYGLRDQPRPGAPRKIGDAQIEAVISLTLETMPADGTHWSSRGMARASGLSTGTVQRIWRAFGLKPHRADTFKPSTDPNFVEKVRDVVGLYLAPPDRAIVLELGRKFAENSGGMPAYNASHGCYYASAWAQPMRAGLPLASCKGSFFCLC